LKLVRVYVLVSFEMPQPIPTGPQNEADQHAQDTHYYRRILHDLIDLGADLARLVHQHAKAEAAKPDTAPSSGPAPDPTIAFERIARTIRRSIALARKLTEPVPAPASNPARHRIAARQRIIRAVEDTIQREATGSEAEPLHAEFLDRLDSPDLEDDIGHRPVVDIIADICRDLGLAALPGTHPWKRRTPADIATLCARAARIPQPGPPPRSQPSSGPPLGQAEVTAALWPSPAHLHGGP
jgi:hypothetical protein